jgi:hypothetical protein
MSAAAPATPFARWWAARGVSAVAMAENTSGNAASPRETSDVAAVAAVAVHGASVGAAREASEVATSDPALGWDREEPGELCGGDAAPPSPTARRAELAGYLAAGLQRPPAWSDPTSVPPPGAWCGCCGRRVGRSGGRWWREAVEPTGWRCGICHPPAHLTAAEVVERRT